MKRQRKINEFNVLIERDAEGFFVATVPALRGCHTQAKSLDKVMERVREAIEVCFERLRGKHVVAALGRGGLVVVRF